MKQPIIRKICTAVLVLCLLSQPTSAAPIGTFRETPTTQEPSQLESGLQNSVGYQGEWKIYVRGHTSVATGAGEVPFQFLFFNPRTGEQYRSSLLAGAFPVTEQTVQFYQDWGATIENMTTYLDALLGEQVNFVSHDNIPQPTGGNVYVFYFEVWDSEWETTYPITIAYRFHQSYYLFAMGINLGDLPEVFEITKQTAVDFVDSTTLPMTGQETFLFTGTYHHTLPAWNYDVINPFQILQQLNQIAEQ